MEKKLHFNFVTTQKVIQKIGMIDSFSGKWEAVKLQKSHYLNELKFIATIQSIGSSTRIEGSTMTDAEVEQLVKDIKISKFTTRDEQEVIGYYEVLEVIYASFNEIDLTESNIRHLHNLLLKYSSKDNNHKGSYKKITNKVVANYPDGIQKTIFNTTQPHLTGMEMGELVTWTNEKLQSKDIHPLLVIAAFIYEFLSIHPFQDGNGRLSRLLTTLLLLKTNYTFIEFISFENLIEQKKKEYYKALMSAQQNRYSKKEIIDNWTIFFLSAIELLIVRFEKKYAIFKETGGYMNERQKKIVEFISKKQPVKISDIQTKFDKLSINTIKKDLLYLTENGLINKTGKFKATVYGVEKK
jgi:Fic family protein